MDVTRSNYESLLPEIENVIKEANFLVIDTELSGLMNGKDANPFHTPAEYYAALLAGASDFLLLQFGLCAFRWNSDTKKYDNHAYNFYLFPSKPDRFFLCQSSSITFLISHGFDFNKLFRDGIPYLTEPIESKLRDQLEEKQKNYNITDNKPDHIPVTEENRNQIEELCSRVKSFLDAEEPEELEIDKLNAFIRKLAFQELGKKYGDKVFMETRTTPTKSRVLVVTRASKESREKLAEDRKQKEWDELNATVGFSRIARLIGQSGKLVIGHNMLLDLVHTLNHFFSPLPTDYMEFKEFANCMFPSLLDTKYMSSLPPFKDKVQSSALPNLLEALSSAPFGIPEINAEPGRGYNQGSNKNHEAGFDAFITGVCFIAMHEHLARMRGAGPGEMIVSAEAPLLRPYLNKVFLFKTAHQDSPYMNLGGKDPTPPRDHVFHLSFPKEWMRSDIVHLFSPFGNVYISFLDETSAFVSLLRREHTTSVMKNLSSCQKFTITPFKKFKAKLGTTQANGGRFQWVSKWQDSIRAPAEAATQPQSRKRRHTQTESVEADSSKSLQRQVSASTSVSNSVPVQREGEAKSQAESGSVSSSVGEHKPRKRRSTSGMFQVQEVDEDLQILCEMRKKRMAMEKGGGGGKKAEPKSTSSLVSSYQENDNWD